MVRIGRLQSFHRTFIIENISVSPGDSKKGPSPFHDEYLRSSTMKTSRADDRIIETMS